MASLTAAALGVCLALLGPDGTPQGRVHWRATQRFTLAWTHSIEHVRWEEDYLVLATPTPSLRLVQARIKGSAAGMEPPADGHWIAGGWWAYQPALPALARLPLTRSGYTADYTWCDPQGCQPMSNLIAANALWTGVWACFDPQKSSAALTSTALSAAAGTAPASR